MNKQVKEKSFVILIVLFIGWLVLARSFHIRKINSTLLENFKVTTGNIISIGSRGRFGANAKYRYFVAGNSFEGDIELSRFCTRHQKDLCVFKELDIPVIYSPKKPNISLILLKHSAYHEWGLVYPDSIKRHLQFYFECGRSYLGDKRKSINPKWRKCDKK